jgi:hypothetical protein
MTTKNSITLRIVKWTGAVLAVLLALLLVATWSINHGPLQTRIRNAVTERTEGILTFRQLDLSLLPRPHLTLHDAVLTIPGRTTGKVPSASIYPEIIPLFSREIRIAHVRLDRPEIAFVLTEESPDGPPEDGQSVFAETRTEIESVLASVRGIAPGFSGSVKGGTITIRDWKGRSFAVLNAVSGTIELVAKGFDIRMTADAARWGHIVVNGALLVGKNSIAVQNATVSGGRSSVSGLSARFGWRVTPWLSIKSGEAAIDLQDIYQRRNMFESLKTQLKDVKTLKGRVIFTAMNFRGRLLHPEQWTMDLTGSVDDLVFESPLVTHPLIMAHAGFKATTSTITFSDARLSYVDSWITTSGTITGWTGARRSADLLLRGHIDREAAVWALKTFNLPLQYLPRMPANLSRCRLSWKEGGPWSVAAKVNFRTGSAVAVDIRTGRGVFILKHLSLERAHESAVFSMERTRKTVDLSFRGVLTQESLDRIFENPPLHVAWLRGDAQAQLFFDDPGRSTAKGALSAGAFFFEPKRGHPVMVKEVELRANGSTVTVKKAALLWGDTPMEIKGWVGAAEEGFRVDLDVAAGSVSMDRIVSAFSPNTQEPGKGPRGPLPVQGTIRVSANDLSYGVYVFAPVKTSVFLDRNSVRIHVRDARLCGIAISGHIQPLSQDMLIDLQTVAVGLPLEPLLDCMSSNKRITGSFNLIGKFHGKGKTAQLIRSIDGWTEFSAKDGKFYTYPLLARLLAFLNVTELLRGKLPDMGRDGFAYKSIKVKGEMKGGKLLLREAVVEGATLNLAAVGEIDFATHTLDVTVLVAPFKTLEFILSKIPVVRNILANRLITVPVRLTGDLNNPDVTPLDPSAIGKNLLGIMRSILSLPFKVLDPLLNPGGK